MLCSEGMKDLIEHVKTPVITNQCQVETERLLSKMENTPMMVGAPLPVCDSDGRYTGMQCSVSR